MPGYVGWPGRDKVAGTGSKCSVANSIPSGGGRQLVNMYLSSLPPSPAPMIPDLVLAASGEIGAESNHGFSQQSGLQWKKLKPSIRAPQGDGGKRGHSPCFC